LASTPEATTKGQVNQPRYKTHKYDLPDIEGGEDLVRHLESLGFNRPSGYGLSAIEYSEIRHWMRLMGLNLTPWEVETLYQLSAIHASMSIRATKHDCPAPCVVESDIDRRKRISDLIFR